MVERGHRARLGPEALQEGLVGGQSRLQDLDGDVALQRHVLGQEDVSGGAGAQSGEQPVPLPKDPADGVRNQGHRGALRLPTAGTRAVDTSSPASACSRRQLARSRAARRTTAASRIGMPSSSAFLSLLAPGASPTTSGEGLLRHAPRRLAAPGHDRLLGLLPRVARHRAGDHHRLAGQRLVGTAPPPRCRRPPSRRRPAPPVVTPAARSRRAPLRWSGGQELGHAGRDHAADAVDGGQLARRRGHRWRRATRRRGPGPAHPSARGGGCRARPGGGSAAVPSSLRWPPTRLAAESCAEALQRDQLLGVEAVEVGRVVDQTGADELDDPLLAQALDVHRRARRVVRDPLDPLGRAVDVGAVGVALARAGARAARRTTGTSSGTSTSACAASARRARRAPARPPRGSRRPPCAR